MPNTPSSFPPESETRPSSAPPQTDTREIPSEYRYLTYKEIKELLEKQGK